jgi:galactose oxidase
MITVDTMLFCAGFALMPDGRLLVSGGHLQDDRGIPTTRFFTQDGAVSDGPDMAHGRWYPTVTVLGDGRAVTVAGRDQNSSVVGVPELWDPATRKWTQLTGATLSLPYYPRNLLAPDGRIFYAGDRVQSRWLDVNAAGSGGPGKWSAGPYHQWRYQRDYGSAVMYEPGKILSVGGGGDPGADSPRDSTSSVPTSTAEIIDLTQPGPQWRFTGSMQFPRRHLNATVLPDGQVLVAGGTQGGGFDDISDANAVHAAEVWDPGTGQWTTLASNTVTRVYHSVSVLLPDGHVVHAASGDAEVGGLPAPSQRNSELFSPPYLFKGARPIIRSAPSGVAYGERFMVETPNSAQITKVTWVRLSSVTHSFDQNQRFNALAFEPTSGGVIVTAPTNPNLAPPGHYTLFLLNRNGVPSVGKIIRIQ